CCYRFTVRWTRSIQTYALSLHGALPIYGRSDRGGLSTHRPMGVSALCAVCLPAGVPGARQGGAPAAGGRETGGAAVDQPRAGARSEEHTSELQSRENLVCRPLLEKKNIK